MTAPRMLRDWGGWAAVRAHARAHGTARVWRADGSFLFLFMDGAKLRRHTVRVVSV